MKIEKIHLENHLLFGTMDINFTGPDGKALDTIVIAGINGTGKTKLLNMILDILTQFGNEHKKSYVDLDLSKLYKKHELKYPSTQEFEKEVIGYTFNATRGRQHIELKIILEDIDEQDRPKIIYMPTEINFDKLETRTQSFAYKYQLRNIIDQKTVNNVPSFLATIINDEIYKSPDLPAKESIEKICSEINSIFDILEIDARIVGLNPEGEKLPTFKNSAGKTFDINNLSSGEKQLFVRIMSLKMMNANNSIILIDEPEISLHPGWQQKIMKIYEKIGDNNQVIAATHSPHVVSSVKKESVILLKKEKGKIKAVDHHDIDAAYGLPVDMVLMELMDLKSVRAPEIDEKIKELWNMINNGNVEGSDFKGKYGMLEELLGSEDEDLFLMRIEMAKLKAGKEKT